MVKSIYKFHRNEKHVIQLINYKQCPYVRQFIEMITKIDKLLQQND